MIIFFLVPFHAFLTVLISSNFGHYTALRLWKEVLLCVCVIGSVYLLITDHKIRFHTLSRRLVWLIFGYMILNIVWGLLALNQHDVTAKALGYGLIVNLRFLAFFLVTWSVALRMSRLRANWQKLVLWPAVGVVVFGILQFIVLPNDFLRHFGYGPGTIVPFETINHNQNYIRIASTLRGANPLGAYLVIPISLLSVLLLRKGRNWRQGLLLAGSTAALLFSFSRSAWIGAVLAVVTILIISPLSKNARKIAIGSSVLTLVIAVTLGLSLRHNMRFENFAFHTQTNSEIKHSSNQGHITALKNGLSDARHHPLGDGPGTAGPASVYNNHPSRIAENYFVQIAQETGWLGLIFFLLINVGVGFLLWSRRADPLALSLFASLIGLTFINLLAHAWADDTLAYVWWGLAGIAMAPDLRAKSEG